MTTHNSPPPSADETSHYRDDGCEIAPRCLSCPLPLCRYDMPPRRADAVKREATVQALIGEGLTPDEAAIRMGVSRRTVFRLKRGKAIAAAEGENR